MRLRWASSESGERCFRSTELRIEEPLELGRVCLGPVLWGFGEGGASNGERTGSRHVGQSQRFVGVQLNPEPGMAPQTLQGASLGEEGVSFVRVVSLRGTGGMTSSGSSMKSPSWVIRFCFLAGPYFNSILSDLDDEAVEAMRVARCTLLCLEGSCFTIVALCGSGMSSDMSALGPVRLGTGFLWMDG